MRPLSIYSEALEDIRAILKSLDESSSRAGGRFLKDLADIQNLLNRHPSAGHPYGPYRRVNLKRYPYHILIRNRNPRETSG